MELTTEQQSVGMASLPVTEPDRVIERLRLLWDHRRFLGRVTAAGLCAAIIIAFLIPAQFESTTQLMPPDDQSNSGMAMAAALAGKMTGAFAGLAGDALGLKSSGDLFIGILKSRTVQDDVINKFDLLRVYGKSRHDLARKRLSENTGISQDRKSGIITITVSDHDPHRAAAIAQQYVIELNEVVNQLSTSSARREREFLAERLGEVKKDLEAAEKEFSEFSSKNTAIDIKEQARAMVGAAATLQGELIAAESELQGLKQIYSENNVRVRSTSARVAELRNQLGKLGGKPGDVPPPPTDKDASSLYPSIRQLPVLGVAFADLYRRTKVQEAVYETLTQEYEMAKVSEAKEIPSIKVLDAADIPEHKSFPPRIIIIVLGSISSFVMASFWILGRVRWNEIDSQTPYKIVATEIFQWVNSVMPWAPHNGSRAQTIAHHGWMKVSRKQMNSEESISKP